MWMRVHSARKPARAEAFTGTTQETECSIPAAQHTQTHHTHALTHTNVDMCKHVYHIYMYVHTCAMRLHTCDMPCCRVCDTSVCDTTHSYVRYIEIRTRRKDLVTDTQTHSHVRRHANTFTRQEIPVCTSPIYTTGPIYTTHMGHTETYGVAYV